MKENNEIDDELLGRWLSGSLTEEERTSFEKSPAFQTYKSIADYSNELETPSFNSEETFDKIQKDIESKKGKIVRVSFYKKLAVAASILVVIGVGSLYLFQGENVIEDTSVLTAQGETKNVNLPDNSEVNLNVLSSISYNKKTWSSNREVELKGEAFFKVKKGKRFTVKTSHGTIEVLGTSFNIRNRNKLTEVVCYTGKVKVTDPKGNSIILTKDEATRIVNGKLRKEHFKHDVETPDWQNGFSQFDAVPLKMVIEELENQYKVKIDCKVDISNRTYAGYFPHDNLRQALKMVFNPMQLELEVINKKLFVIE